MKFRYGDRVIITNKNDWMSVGNKGTVIYVEDDGTNMPGVKFDNGKIYYIYEKDMELYTEELTEKINKIPEVIKERWLLEFRNGDIGMLDKNGDILEIVDGQFTGIAICRIKELNENLENINASKHFDVVRIEKPRYEVVWERHEEIKKMTIEDIEKELGYKIEIVKEEK